MAKGRWYRDRGGKKVVGRREEKVLGSRNNGPYTMQPESHSFSNISWLHF
jgi:hypothetical protein